MTSSDNRAAELRAEARLGSGCGWWFLPVVQVGVGGGGGGGPGGILADGDAAAHREPEGCGRRPVVRDGRGPARAVARRSGFVGVRAVSGPVVGPLRDPGPAH